ncbi:ARM repeat-containing protein [Rhizophagus irregularis]|uniref:ARM repeat-containing protein n=1 Tax=Rhizophagus irregularis TaxID=588596 RepID=A0A2I1FVW5_9GLOM|nr:ARM repeat-containing protein [Rhizophagus irregularis]
MFSTRRQLERRTGKSGTPRFEYLEELVNEYQNTNDQEAKYQVLAILANFAYDPINYDWLLQLNVVDLFLDTLSEPDEKLKEFGLGGLCNLCLETRNKEHIIDNGGIPMIIDCLSNENLNTQLSAITTLIFLITPKSEQFILTEHVKEEIIKLLQCDSVCVKNLATIFLEDYFSSKVDKNASENVNEYNKQNKKRKDNELNY